MSKHIPILFSTEMVRAILDGRKTQTRRVVKPQPNENGISYMKNAPLNWETIYKEEWKPWKLETEEGESIAMHCPYGQPGDVLWVREKWCHTIGEYLHNETNLPFCYKADVKDITEQKEKEYMEEMGWKWKPSIHMPKEACRLWLKVKAVWVERLQDISEKDAKAEGVDLNIVEGTYRCYLKQRGWEDSEHLFLSSAKLSFQSLWRSINRLESWNANPWVWVIEFEPCKMPDNFLTTSN